MCWQNKLESSAKHGLLNINLPYAEPSPQEIQKDKNSESVAENGRWISERNNKDLLSCNISHYRMIFNSAYNFAIKWKKPDDNPVKIIQQHPGREAKDLFVKVSELPSLIENAGKKGY